MKKIILCFCVVFTLLMSVSVMTANATTDYTLNGTSFTVYTADGLMEVAKIINGESSDTSTSYTAYNINIASDIDMSGKAWKPIGKNDSFVYTGTVNGNGHTISNLTRENYTSTCLGFIGVAGINVNIKNLKFTSLTFSSNRADTAYVGGIIGKAKGAGTMSVSNCSVEGTIQTSTTGAGGIVGALTSIHASFNVSNCSINADITAIGGNAGGIIGYTASGATVNQSACTITGRCIQSGTAFHVYTADALMSVASKINSDTAYSSAIVNIEKDIDMSGKAWQPIGNSSQYAFTGTVNGNGYTVSNLSAVNYTAANLGFIGVAGNNATVKNLHLSNLNFKSNKEHVGAIIANVTATAEITNCTVKGSLYSSGNHVGGLVGVVSSSASKLKITSCAVDASIRAVGHSASGIVAGDTASGYTASNISTYPSVTANKVFITGDITANYRVGSFMGYNSHANVDFRNCISLATLNHVSASDNGAFIAIDNGSKIYLENCIAKSDLHAFFSLAMSNSSQTVELKNCYLMKDKIGKQATIATYNKYGFYTYDATATYKYKLIADVIVDGVGAKLTPATTTNTAYQVPVIQYNLPSGTETEVMTRAYDAAMAMFDNGSIQQSFVHKHNWTNESEKVAPTYYSTGKNTFECSKCNAVKTVETPCKESSVNWKFDSASKTLTIYGSGSMGKFATPNTIPWKAHRNETRSIVIENGVTDICDYAFYDCTVLKSITIPSGVTVIGAYSFHNCRSLFDIILPQTVSTIHINAFEYCSNLKSINIPKSVTSIGYGAFRYAKYATPVITCESANYSVVGNCLIDVSAKTVISGFQNSTIPTSESIVTTIGRSAFQGCKISDITIPPNVTAFAIYAFADCTALKSITISSNVTEISEGAFFGCACLNKIDIPSAVTSIGPLAFNECSSLQSVTLPVSLTSIDISAFKECIALEKATFNGTLNDWSKISILNGNDILKSKITTLNSVAMVNTNTGYTLKEEQEE